MDWGEGRYEDTATALDPAAAQVVARAAVALGDTVLDIACGTGNAALHAARAGGTVTGLDRAARLVAVARERAEAEELEVAFVEGDAQALPFADGAFGVVLSVFGLIFAPEPERAVGEALRVLAPGGRLLVTTWAAGGPIDEAFTLIGRAAAEVGGGAGTWPERFAWDDADAVRALFAGLGATATLEEASLPFTAPSAEAFVAASEADHPLLRGARATLTAAGAYDGVRARAVEALERGSEATDGSLRVTSRYWIVRVDAADAAPRAVTIREDAIRLGQLLKLAGVVGTGGAGKALLEEGGVRVNGEPETRRGRQVRRGDVVTAAGESIRVA